MPWTDSEGLRRFSTASDGLAPFSRLLPALPPSTRASLALRWLLSRPGTLAHSRATGVGFRRRWSDLSVSTPVTTTSWTDSEGPRRLSTPSDGLARLSRLLPAWPPSTSPSRSPSGVPRIPSAAGVGNVVPQKRIACSKFAATMSWTVSEGPRCRRWFSTASGDLAPLSRVLLACPLSTSLSRSLSGLLSRSGFPPHGRAAGLERQIPLRVI